MQVHDIRQEEDENNVNFSYIAQEIEIVLFIYTRE